jgi:DcmR-like sensory protein
MTGSDRPIFFAGSTLHANRHVCAFFSSAKEEYETLLPFVRDGFERGERAYHVCHSNDRDEHLEQLRNAGIDVTETQRSRQLEGGECRGNIPAWWALRQGRNAHADPGDT